MVTADIPKYEVPFQRTVLIGNRLTPPEAMHTALLLHGGGTSSAEGFLELRLFLYERGIETLAFDCVGHGRTGGFQLGTTLHDRVQQVRAVIQSQRLKPSSLTIAGFSMGAYVAVKATVEVGIPRLCLAIPAAYAAEAYKAPFGPEFSKIIRTPRSWEKSDAFDLVRSYTGHLLVLSAEKDKIVPPEIPEMYGAIRKNGASSVHHVVSGSGHNLSEHYEREPSAKMAAYKEIALLCLRGVSSPGESHP